MWGALNRPENLAEFMIKKRVTRSIDEQKKAKQWFRSLSSNKTSNVKDCVIRIGQKFSYFKHQPDSKFFHFELRHGSPFKRPPLHQVIMLDDLKIMYLPIAKNACSSLKRVVAELGGLHLNWTEDIHRKLDNENTGLLFFNRDDEDIRTALSQPGWLRFAIIRNPLDRLVSVYVEKFIINRLSPDVKITCDPVLMRTYQLGWLRHRDYERGVTFRSFVTDIISQSPDRLDPHWRPQSQYLKAYPFTHIYHIDNLDEVSRDLSDHTGKDVQIPRSNVSRNSDQSELHVENAADLLPRDLPCPERISVESFAHGQLRSQILSYFAEDFELFARAQSAAQEREPPGASEATIVPSC